MMKEEKINIATETKTTDSDSLSDVEARVIQPFYNVDGISLYKADCRTAIASLPPVHWTITDPPFNANYGFENDNLTKQEFYNFTAEWISKAEEKTTEGFIIIVDPKYIEPFHKIGITKFPYHHTYTWFKKNAMRGMQGGFANKTEIIVWTARKPAKVDRYPNDVWEIPLIPRDVNHPTPKPIKLLELILRKFTYEGETILDPFAGSGSTLRACKELGRKAVGIEIEQEYCNIILNEVGQIEMQFNSKAV